jgi:hypothetical protein
MMDSAQRLQIHVKEHHRLHPADTTDTVEHVYDQLSSLTLSESSFCELLLPMGSHFETPGEGNPTSITKGQRVATEK